MFIINGSVRHLKKYDSEAKTWRKCRSNSEKGSCASIVEYKPVLRRSGEEVNYVIIACNKTLESIATNRERTLKSTTNNRDKTLESITTNYDTVSGSVFSMDKVCEYFSKQSENYRLQLFLVDEDAPLREDAKLLAEQIDIIATNPNTKSVSLIGISECGAMSFYDPSFFKSEDSFKKTNVVTVGTPFNGTITHSPHRIYELIKARIVSTFGDTVFSEKLRDLIILSYRKMRINSHRFYDVALKNELPSGKLEFYDASFIWEIFSEKNLHAIRKIRSYKNFVLKINGAVVAEAIRRRNKTSFNYCIMHKILLAGKDSNIIAPVESQELVEDSDGVVPVKSQESVKEFLGDIGVPEVLYATNNILEESAFGQILNYVSENIRKEANLGGFQKKKV